MPQREIAKLFGISRSTVSWVVTGKSWVKEKKGYYRRGNRWHARITINYQEHHLGSFDTKEAAHAAFAAAAAKVRAEQTKGN